MARGCEEEAQEVTAHIPNKIKSLQEAHALVDGQRYGQPIQEDIDKLIPKMEKMRKDAFKLSGFGDEEWEENRKLAKAFMKKWEVYEKEFYEILRASRSLGKKPKKDKEPKENKDEEKSVKEEV